MESELSHTNCGVCFTDLSFYVNINTNRGQAIGIEVGIDYVISNDVYGEGYIVSWLIAELVAIYAGGTSVLPLAYDFFSIFKRNYF